MSRLWQIFVAPGEENAPLPLPPSPWHAGREVRVPREHWLLILQFATSMNRDLSDELSSYSTAADNNPDDEVLVTPQRLVAAVEFMRMVRDQLRVAAPLVSDATDDVPDELTNDEHARMLDAVIAVFEEAVLLQQPFRAWVE